MIQGTMQAGTAPETSGKKIPHRREKKRRFSRPKTPLMLRLTRRGVTFLFILLLTTLCFYAAGCAQNFLDSDITLLLFCVTSVSILLLFFSLAAVAECLLFTALFKSAWFLLYALPFAILGASGAVIAALSDGVNLLARGL